MAVVLYFWRVPSKSIPSAIWKIAVGRRALRKIEGVTFSKLLGCGRGITFTPGDADLHRWGLIACIPQKDLESLDNSSVIERWRKNSESEYRLLLLPTKGHGHWSGKEPFDFSQDNYLPGESVVAITRARITLRRYFTFLKAVRPVVNILHTAPGLISTFGIGEAPIGLQGTFSLWRDEASLVQFAFNDSAHRKAITASENGRWFREELFARFSVQEIRGSL